MSAPTPDEMLIANARRWDFELMQVAPKTTKTLIHRLADALEALSAHPAEETEWEYQVVNSRGRWESDVPDNDPSWFIPADWPDGFRLDRRRKVGPWSPVPTDGEGETDA